MIYRPRMPTPKQHLEAGSDSFERGEPDDAARHYEAAARGFLEAGEPAEAMSALSNLSVMRRASGDFAGARVAIDEAIALFAPEMTAQERAPHLLTRAAVLDRLVVAEAAGAWRDAAAVMDDQPMMKAVCLAHYAGALMPVDRQEAIRQARASIDLLGGGTTIPLVVGILGAIGDSAPGASGVPFLAQAVTLMFAHTEACNSSNAPFLSMLAERLGYEHPLAESMCMIGLAMVSERRGTPDVRAVMFHADRIFRRSAAARSLEIKPMMEQFQERWAKDGIEQLLHPLKVLAAEGWIFGDGDGNGDAGPSA